MGIEDIVDKAKDIAGDVAEKAKEFGGDVKDFTGDAVDKVKDVAGDIKDRFDGDDEPSAAGEPSDPTVTGESAAAPPA